MFKIGDFSRLSQVSVKTLRYYDELGLLKPGEIDSFTGYRYYAADQLPRLNRILALKDLGFSLEQIRLVLSDELPASEIRGMLKMRKAAIQQNLLDEQVRLARIEARLAQIEMEDSMPAYDIVLKKIEPQHVAYLRDVVESYNHVGELFDRLAATIAATGIKPAGPLGSVYYDPEYREKDVDVAATVPVAESVTSNTVKICELEGITQAACTIHKGSYNSLMNAYTALMTWIEANGYQVNGPNREVYLISCDGASNENEFITEIQIPVTKR